MIDRVDSVRPEPAHPVICLQNLTHTEAQLEPLWVRNRLWTGTKLRHSSERYAGLVTTCRTSAKKLNTLSFFCILAGSGWISLHCEPPARSSRAITGLP
jgi:hypothetical protein